MITRKELLEIVAEKGPLTAAEISIYLGLTKSRFEEPSMEFRECLLDCLYQGDIIWNADRTFTIGDRS